MRRKQPGRTAMRFLHLRTVGKKAHNFKSRAGGRDTEDQTAAHRALGQMGYSDMCVNGTPVSVIAIFL
jgi:hypothetical protein